MTGLIFTGHFFFTKSYVIRQNTSKIPKNQLTSVDAEG